MSSIQEKVTQIVVEQLSVEEEQVTPTASFVEQLGADSLNMEKMLMAPEPASGTETPAGGAGRTRTPRGTQWCFREGGGEGGAVSPVRPR